jgi:hypothetical protein
MSIQKSYNQILFILSLKYPNIMIPLALVPTFIIYTYVLYIVRR